YLPVLSRHGRAILEFLASRLCTRMPGQALRCIVRFRTLLLFPHAGFIVHVRNRLFAGPAPCMNASIDDQSHRPEKLVAQASQVAEWVVIIPASLLRQPLTIKRPGF